jgi:hypothetical protein
MASFASSMEEMQQILIRVRIFQSAGFSLQDNQKVFLLGVQRLPTEKLGSVD